MVIHVLVNHFPFSPLSANGDSVIKILSCLLLVAVSSSCSSVNDQQVSETSHTVAFTFLEIDNNKLMVSYIIANKSIY